MPSDRSRRTDGRRDGYTGVVAQQGRVTLDRDFNAEHGYLAGRIEREACDVIGPCGTPDDGFAISILSIGSPGPALWSPPFPVSPPAHQEYDFLIGPGTMYVGGERAEFAPLQAGHPVTYSFYDQPDWIPPALSLRVDKSLKRRGRDLVFLGLSEQEVGAVEDPDLLEVALGGPDTTQRLRLMRVVGREAVTGADCVTAWDEALALWQARDGLVLDPATMRLQPEVRLLVSFADAGGSTDRCDPIVQNGYLGAENQTIRVQISEAGSPGSPADEARLLWGYDNASFLYRATPLAANPAMLTITPSPPDQFHIPQAGQVVEILLTAAVLGSEPDMTDPTGQRLMTRCVARPTGVVRRLTQAYGPVTAGDATSYIVLDEPLPAEYLGADTPLFMRVWQSEIAFDPAGDTILLTDDATGTSTGVEVTISLPAGAVLTRGAFWLLAVRPSTPQAVYPQRLLTAPQPPDGPRSWACPLAVIDWSNLDHPTVTDCRNPFDGLVELTRRRSGCCTVSLSPADLARGLSLQAAIDHAARLGPGATVCLMAGTYKLPVPLRLTSVHAGITIEACGGHAALTTASGDNAAFSDGMVTLVGAHDVTLRGLAIQPAVAHLPHSASARLETILKGHVAPATLKQIVAGMRAMIGVHAANCVNLTLEDCTVDFEPRSDTTTLDYFGAGLFLQGNCRGLRVRDCRFTSGIMPTFRPLGGATTGVLATAGNEKVVQSLAVPETLAAQNTLAEAAGVQSKAAAISAGGNVAGIAAGANVAAPSVAAASGAAEGIAAGGAAAASAAAPSAAAPSAPASTAPAPSTPESGTQAAAGVAPVEAAASPPSLSISETFAAQTLDRVRTSFTAFASDLETVNAAVSRELVVVTVGCLAMLNLPEGDKGAAIACHLGEACLADNTFANLTMPVYSVADATTLRLRDNNATHCIGGFWLELPGWQMPSDDKANDLFRIAWTTSQAFAERLILDGLGPTYPLPAGASHAASKPVVAPTTLMLTGNQIEPVSSTRLGTTALLILANLASKDETDSSVSLLISSNRIRARCGRGTAAALLLVPEQERCAITGNLILNEGTRQDYGPSLWLVPDTLGEGTQLLSVTGNVLQGGSDLPFMPRANTSPAQTWLPYNAAPT